MENKKFNIKNEDKSKKEINQTTKQDTTAQNDGFRYDYDDSSDLNS